MHPNIVSAKPGKCELCGMNLVPGDPMSTAAAALTCASFTAVAPGTFSWPPVDVVLMIDSSSSAAAARSSSFR